jgi:hypothetical protein
VDLAHDAAAAGQDVTAWRAGFHGIHFTADRAGA